MRSARRQARHSVRIALHRAREYASEGGLSTPADWERFIIILSRVDNHLSTMEDYYEVPF